MSDEREKTYTPKPEMRAKMDEFLRIYVEDPQCFGNIAKCMRQLNLPRTYFSDRWMNNAEFAQQFEDTKALFAGEVSVTFHRLALGKLGKVNPHALIALDRKLNRQEYQHDTQSHSGINIVVNMPGLGPGSGSLALPAVADEAALEASGFVIRELEYVSKSSLGLDDGEEWDIDESN